MCSKWRNFKWGDAFALDCFVWQIVATSWTTRVEQLSLLFVFTIASCNCLLQSLFHRPLTCGFQLFFFQRSQHHTLPRCTKLINMNELYYTMKLLFRPSVLGLFVPITCVFLKAKSDNVTQQSVKLIGCDGWQCYNLCQCFPKVYSNCPQTAVNKKNLLYYL
jgi:hypothetical protein